MNGGSDFTLNVALFIPFGLALGLMAVVPIRAWMAGLTLAIAIESLQHFGFPGGRVANVTDLTANSTGSFIGGLIGAHWRLLLFPTAQRAGQIALVSVMFVVSLCCFCCWALQPYSALTNSVGDPRGSQPAGIPFPTEFGWYHGLLTEAQLNSHTIARSGDGPAIIESNSAEASRLQGSATIIGRDERDFFVPFIYVHEPDRLPKVLLGQRGQDAQLRGTLNASRLRLAGPTLTLNNAFSAIDPGPRRFQFDVTPEYWRLSAQSAAAVHHNVMRISLGLGWTLFQTVVHVGDPLARIVTLLWLFVLWLPVGYWCAIAGKPADTNDRNLGNFRRWQFVAAAVIALLFTLWLVPRAMGIAATLPHEWGLSIAGLAVGVFLATRFYHYIPAQ